VSRRRRRCVLRNGRPPGALGDVFVSAVRAAEGRDAGIRRGDGVSSWLWSCQREATGRGHSLTVRPLGVRDRQLLLDARRRRIRRPGLHPRRRHAGGSTRRRDQPPPVAGHLPRRPTHSRRDRGARAGSGGDPAIVGGTLVGEGRPFTVVGVTPPGFFGETLQADPPDLWIPLQQEPLIAGHTSILRGPAAAWLRVIGRVRANAAIEAMGPRLTGVLRGWIEHESGYP